MCASHGLAPIRSFISSGSRTSSTSSGELAPPEDDEAQVKSILKQAQAALDEIEADPRVLAGDDPFEKVNQRAKKFGLTACA